ncbi:hypothetical protein PIB30_069510 [Stylosanthes scabra]|uniref:Uncharacterized protein n=1 Tax=Stylosanthes scabra TaxID=79078 RepID=A0ABU6XP27_9FABA|nr:hypothetical protein [Stylosanthes scabra]
MITQDVGAELEEQEDIMIVCLPKVTEQNFMPINRTSLWDQRHHSHISHYHKTMKNSSVSLDTTEAMECKCNMEVSMAEKRASNSSMSIDESTATDKTQPSPGTSGVIVTISTGSGVIPPPVSTPSTWPQYGLPRNYSPPYETTSRGGGVFNPRNPSPVTQYHAQGWHSPHLQGGNYGYSNNPQPPFDPFGMGIGGYNPPVFGTFPQPSMNNPPYFLPVHSMTPVIQPMPIPQPS